VGQIFEDLKKMAIF